MKTVGGFCEEAGLSPIWAVRACCEVPGEFMKQLNKYLPPMKATFKVAAVAALLGCFLTSGSTAVEIDFPSEDCEGCPEDCPEGCPHLGGVMNAASAGDVIIIQGDGPYVIPSTVNWSHPITVKPKDANTNPVIKSTWTEFLQPFDGAQGTQFGDNDGGTITLDAGGNREGPGEADPCRPGPMWNLIDLKHGPGDPIVFENVHIVNPGCNENSRVDCVPVVGSPPGIRAIITQHGIDPLSGDSGASYTLDNCTIDFRTFGNCSGSATNSILLDQDSANIKLIDCEFLVDQPTGVNAVIRLDGKEDPQDGNEVYSMNLDIDNCRIEGFNAVIDFMQGDVTATIDNSCISSLGGFQNAALSTKNNPNLDGADVTVNDSILVSDGSLAAVMIRGQDPRSLTMDHCDVYCTNGDGILIQGNINGTYTADITNCNVSSLSGFNSGLASDPDSGENLNAAFNSVFANGGTDYAPEWNVTNAVAAGDPLYTDIDNCDASYLNVILATADDTGGPLGSAGPGMIPESLQIPGDCNQDGELDLSDVICLLGHLFQGSPESLPCSTDAANLGLMDCNRDGGIDLSDAIYKLAFLFQGGPGPVAGSACISIGNCPENPGCP
jgi:hypothetical protein